MGGLAPLVMTTSWDKTVQFWDPRAPGACVNGLQLAERIFSADVSELGVGIAVTADHNVSVFDLRVLAQKGAPSLTRAAFPITPLKLTPRAVKLFKGSDGFFAVSSIEGRCSVRNIDQAKDAEMEQVPGKPHERRPRSFAFRCHRDTAHIYPVNFIAVHPNERYHAVFATGGSDGSIVYWHRQDRLKLKEHKTKDHAAKKTPVNDGTWNAAGDLFVYGSSYDWSKGQEFYRKGDPPTLSVRQTTEAYLQKSK
jgi:WD40 repeat protein